MERKHKGTVEKKIIFMIMSLSVTLSIKRLLSQTHVQVSEKVPGGDPD